MDATDVFLARPFAIITSDPIAEKLQLWNFKLVTAVPSINAFAVS
jgi:hypothetical protein